MVDFTEIESKYVKNKIKNLEFNKKNEEYIEALMDIERAVQGKICGMWAGYKIKSFKKISERMGRYWKRA